MTTARLATRPLAASVRPAKRNGLQPRKRSRVVPYLFLGALILYFLIPIWWLFVASTKNVNGLFQGTSGALWFDKTFAFGPNLVDLFTYNDGIYLRWLGNSLFYALSGGIGATVLSVLAGYGFAKFRFRGRRFFFSVLLGSVMVPLTALVIPTFILLSDLNLTDTIWAVILP
ncbi:MAG: multiple sugar transport system permease protein, partial [Actinomycetota bacterium]|nr:multiple sugar transport system permease protein [Actinomycetota bacterium]